MNEQLTFLAIIVSRLEAARIPYMVTGSIALAVYATPRMTRDIDVVIDCDETQAVELATAFQKDSYASIETAREAARAHGMFNVIHNESLLKADFIVRKPDAFNAERFSRRQQVSLGTFSAYFISAEDLVLSKLTWSAGTDSARQADDIRALLGATPGLDWQYLTAWAARLNVLDQLQRLRAP